MATVLAACITSLIRYAERRGLAREAMLREIGLQEPELADPNGRVAAEVDTKLWQLVHRELGEDSVGLDYGQRRAEEAFEGVVGVAARAAKTVEDALRVAATYHRLLKDDGVAAFEVERGPGREGAGVLRWLPASSPITPFEDALVACCVVLARSWTGRELSPVRVRFRRARPQVIEPYERLFACPLEFGAPATEIAFSKDALAVPLLSEYAAVARYSSYLRLAADTYAARLEETRSLRERVLAAIDTVGIEQGAVAAYLGLSTRTFQRRLLEQGTSFHALVGEHRRRLAYALLRDRSLTTVQIAQRCGFVDAQSLRRALRRWGHEGDQEIMEAETIRHRTRQRGGG